MGTPIRFEFTTEDFFKLPMIKMQLEQNPIVGRIHFIYKGRIVAVAKFVTA
jgi:hypothetical protein